MSIDFKTGKNNTDFSRMTMQDLCDYLGDGTITIGTVSNPEGRQRCLMEGHYNENVSKTAQAFYEVCGGMAHLPLGQSDELAEVVREANAGLESVKMIGATVNFAHNQSAKERVFGTSNTSSTQFEHDPSEHEQPLDLLNQNPSHNKQAVPYTTEQFPLGDPRWLGQSDDGTWMGGNNPEVMEVMDPVTALGFAAAVTGLWQFASWVYAKATDANPKWLSMVSEVEGLSNQATLIKKLAVEGASTTEEIVALRKLFREQGVSDVNEASTLFGHFSRYFEDNEDKDGLIGGKDKITYFLDLLKQGELNDEEAQKYFGVHSRNYTLTQMQAAAPKVRNFLPLSHLVALERIGIKSNLRKKKELCKKIKRFVMRLRQ